MPGPTGGGRSGGGGGIGGGARGGFSGGSHGGFSSGSNRTFRSGVPRGAGSFYTDSPDNPNGEEDTKKRIRNMIILVIFIAVFAGGPVLSMVGNLFSDLASPSPDIWAEMDSVIVMEEEPLFDIGTAPRARLDESLCKPSNVWYLDRCGLFILSEERDDVENALAYFYEKTGVQPLLVTARSIDGQLDPDWDTVDTYLYDLYIELFGEDEGHYIFLYFMHEDDSYTLYYMPGWDAMSVVDDNASAILMDYIEWYYQESSSYGEMFASAFAEAADAIMYTAEADTSELITDYEALSTAPPASTVPAVEVDSSEDLTVPVVELTNEVESVEPDSVVIEDTTEAVEVTYHEEITYYEEPDSDFVWDENVTDQAVEHYITADTLKYIAGGFVILLAVILFVVYILWDKKKMRDLEDDI
ncbi:MAG: hypothetical protein E7523_04675 [Ruminococcaceae bacterium]|nr:hypothetical protein [Oscillospiraceae bacterium]